MSTVQKPIVAGNFAKNAAVNYFNSEIHNTLKNADLVDKYGFFVGNHHFDLSDEIHLLHKTIHEFIR